MAEMLNYERCSTLRANKLIESLHNLIKGRKDAMELHSVESDAEFLRKMEISEDQIRPQPCQTSRDPLLPIGEREVYFEMKLVIAMSRSSSVMKRISK